MLKPMKYCALIIETEEILECTNFQVLYKNARSCARYYVSYENAPCITVKFYIDLPNHEFNEATPYHTMKECIYYDINI